MDLFCRADTAPPGSSRPAHAWAKSVLQKYHVHSFKQILFRHDVQTDIPSGNPLDRDLDGPGVQAAVSTADASQNPSVQVGGGGLRLIEVAQVLPGRSNKVGSPPWDGSGVPARAESQHVHVADIDFVPRVGGSYLIQNFWEK